MNKLEEFLEQNENDQSGKIIEYEKEKYLWKISAAAAIEVSEKTLMRAAKRGEIKQIVSNNNKIYYLITDLLKYEGVFNKVSIKPNIAEPEQTGLAATAPPDFQTMMQGFGAMFQTINKKLDSRAESELQKLAGKIMLDINEFSEFSGFGKTQLLTAIHAAEKAGTLKRYKGAKGKAIWKAADLDAIIDDLPEVDLTEVQKRQPPKKKAKGVK